MCGRGGWAGGGGEQLREGRERLRKAGMMGGGQGKGVFFH